MAASGGANSNAIEIKFETLKQQFYPERVGFRPNTTMFPVRLNFLFMNGGMGDYITWMQAIRWLMSEATWIHGLVIGPVYFKEVAEYWIKDYPNWKFHSYTDVNNIPDMNNTPFRGPVELARESLNATGAHLSTCGWVYFTNKECAPDGWDWYPPFKQADLDKIELPAEASVLKPKTYAVVTTGKTTNSREVPSGGWNPIIEHVKSKGLTPVFLGKSVVETGNPKNIHTRWDAQTKHDGLDLRDKTSLMQAAAIMSRAAVVIGHDNGLLHLAGCTEVPIVFGYNIALPKHREPKRPVGKVYNVLLAPGELACYGCQSNTNFVIGYNFRECFYKDLKCQQMLFEKDGWRWKAKIDQALAEGS